MRPIPSSSSILRSDLAAGTRPSSSSEDDWKLALVATLAYGVVVTVLASHHELWRDEVRALNIAAHSGTPAQLVRRLENEGHPILWYLLLYAGYHLTGTMLVIKPIAALVAELQRRPRE